MQVKSNWVSEGSKELWMLGLTYTFESEQVCELGIFSPVFIYLLRCDFIMTFKTMEMFMVSKIIQS